jgi:hypothetical protein
MAIARKSTVPGHPMWRARTVGDGRGRAVRARHRIWVWQTITVETRDLRYGYEAIARYLSGGHAGYRVIDRRRPAAVLGRAVLGR